MEEREMMILIEASRCDGIYQIPSLSNRETAHLEESLETLVRLNLVKRVNDTKYKLTSRGWDEADEIDSYGGPKNILENRRQMLSKINDPDQSGII